MMQNSKGSSEPLSYYNATIPGFSGFFSDSSRKGFRNYSSDFPETSFEIFSGTPPGYTIEAVPQIISEMLPAIFQGMLTLSGIFPEFNRKHFSYILAF